METVSPCTARPRQAIGMAVRNKTGLHNALSKATSHFTLSTLLVLLFNLNGNNRWRRFLENLEIENANDGINVIFFLWGPYLNF